MLQKVSRLGAVFGNTFNNLSCLCKFVDTIPSLVAALGIDALLLLFLSTVIVAKPKRSAVDTATRTYAATEPHFNARPRLAAPSAPDASVAFFTSEDANVFLSPSVCTSTSEENFG